MSTIPQTEHSLTTFVADYLRSHRLFGAACRVRCNEAAPLTLPESWELCREIIERDGDLHSKMLADYLVRLVAAKGWREIEVGMRALQATKSNRAACDAIMAYQPPEGSES